MRQLTFREIELTSHEAQVVASLENLEVLKEVFYDEPPQLHDSKYYEPDIIEAVLLINTWQREAEAANQPSAYIECLVHAQDWLCRYLEEWVGWVLREL